MSYIRRYIPYILLPLLLAACGGTVAALVRQEFLLSAGLAFAGMLLLLNGYIFYRQDRKREPRRAPREGDEGADAVILAHMSHEIRTALMVISGVAEIFDNTRDNLDDRQKKLIGVLVSSTASLKELMRDFIDISQIEGAAPADREKSRERASPAGPTVQARAVQARTGGGKRRFEAGTALPGRKRTAA